jgi:hypothetical protein
MLVINLDGRCIFETAEGYVGLAPLQAMQGDEICVILGCKTPLLLRPAGNDIYPLVGLCYTCGITKGGSSVGVASRRFPTYLSLERDAADLSILMLL